MSLENKLTDKERWLAAEYALGALHRDGMATAERLAAEKPAFRACVEGWQEQLNPLLAEVKEVKAPQRVWYDIENNLFVDKAVNTAENGIWKMIAAFTSTAGIACLGVLLYFTQADFSSKRIGDLQAQIAAYEKSVKVQEADLQTALAEVKSSSEALIKARQQLETANANLTVSKQEVSEIAAALDVANAQVAAIRREISEARPLVATLTQSGDNPAFVAQYDPLKKALLIRTAVEDTDEKVPEVWLIPDSGERKGDVLSLGVMNEAKPDALAVPDDLLASIGNGGTLAITMEPPGGSPTGVATGPVVAVGALQAF